jgi:hypothetical protein
MLYVSIFVELLRSRPQLAVSLAVFIQATLWFLVPTLFYAGPPGDLPLVLAVGHEYQLGSYLGPPLAFWFAELAFEVAGRRLFGVYLLSQICVVVTFWAVFSLGRLLVGAQQAAIAVLLLVGVAAFTLPTPDFGPVILAMPLWSLILLHYWRAVGEGRRGFWLVLALEVGLLLLTTYLGLILVALLALFTALHRDARRALRSIDPWIAVVVAGIVTLPHLLWLADTGVNVAALVGRLRAADVVSDTFLAWARQLALILAAHAGLVALVALAAGWPWPRAEPAPVIVRAPIDALARHYVYFFALLPAFAGSLTAALLGGPGPVGGMGPLVVLSGLAVVVAAGEGIRLGRQHIVIATWFALLVVPPAMAVASLYVLPWFNVDLRVAQPAKEVASFFADSYQRRIGSPLQIVAGEPRTAALIALGAPSRPSVLFSAAPERSPWATLDMLRAKGGLVVWPTTDTAGTPPADIKASLADLVPEVPRAFERAVQGRLPLMRIGWGVIRPQGQPADSAPPAAKQ